MRKLHWQKFINTRRFFKVSFSEKATSGVAWYSNRGFGSVEDPTCVRKKLNEDCGVGIEKSIKCWGLNSILFCYYGVFYIL